MMGVAMLQVLFWQPMDDFVKSAWGQDWGRGAGGPPLKWINKVNESVWEFRGKDGVCWQVVLEWKI